LELLDVFADVSTPEGSDEEEEEQEEGYEVDISVQMLIRSC
jgi:hypothetical protein